MKVWLLAVLLAVVAVAPFLYIIYVITPTPQVSETTTSPQALAVFEFSDSKPSSVLEAGAIFQVLACRVLDGYRYSLKLENGKWIEAHLPVAVKEEASPVLIELFNNSVPPLPTIKLLRDVGDYWIVDLFLMVDNKNERVVDYLHQNNLLFD